MQADPRTSPQTDSLGVEEQQRRDLVERIVTVEPNGTGPTSTGTFDTDEDKAAGSGSP